MCPAIGLRHLGLGPDLLTTSRFLKLLGLPLIEGFPFPNPLPKFMSVRCREGKKMFILHSHPTLAPVSLGRCCSFTRPLKLLACLTRPNQLTVPACQVP